MLHNNRSNILAEQIIKSSNIKVFILDKDNIVWKFINNEWIGKRSVWTKDFRSCWLEDTTIENIKTWWWGESADYNEVFKRN